jgi:hypothetical protein
LPQLQSGDRLVRELSTCTCSACVAARAGSTSASRSPCHPPEPSVSLNGTPSRQRSLLPECATAASTMHQFGTTLAPSTAALGAARWISASVSRGSGPCGRGKARSLRAWRSSSAAPRSATPDRDGRRRC